jgi:hypothetical protein
MGMAHLVLQFVALPLQFACRAILLRKIATHLTLLQLLAGHGHATKHGLCVCCVLVNCTAKKAHPWAIDGPSRHVIAAFVALSLQFVCPTKRFKIGGPPPDAPPAAGRAWACRQDLVTCRHTRNTNTA